MLVCFVVKLESVLDVYHVQLSHLWSVIFLQDGHYLSCALYYVLYYTICPICRKIIDIILEQM